jgi:hypothetical protein
VPDDLLEWKASYRPAFEGLRVLGARWSPRASELREILARNQAPYRFLDVETPDKDREVRQALDLLAPGQERFPVGLVSRRSAIWTTRSWVRNSLGTGCAAFICYGRDRFAQSGARYRAARTD